MENLITRTRGASFYYALMQILGEMPSGIVEEFQKMFLKVPPLEYFKRMHKVDDILDNQGENPLEREIRKKR